MIESFIDTLDTYPRIRYYIRDKTFKHSSPEHLVVADGSRIGPGSRAGPPPRGEPSRPAPGPSVPKSSGRCWEPSASAADRPGSPHSVPGQPVPGQPVPGSPDQRCKPSSPAPHRPGQFRPAPGHPGSGHRDPAAPSGEVGDRLVPCGEAGAWWEGDELVDEDDLDAAEWVDPPGEPLDEQAIRAARARTISAEVLGTGFWRGIGAGPGPGPGARPGAGPVVRSRSGFGSGDDLDELEPGPALAGLTDTATRPDRIAGLDDDELIGAVRAWRRLESWSAAGTLAVVTELARRRPADGTAPAAPGQFPDQPSEFLTDEIAAALTLTGPAADTCLDRRWIWPPGCPAPRRRCGPESSTTSRRGSSPRRPTSSVSRTPARWKTGSCRARGYEQLTISLSLVIISSRETQ